jgi:hypothetical protein
MYLDQLVTTAKKDGWAVGIGKMDSIPYQAVLLGMTEVRMRSSDPSTTTLRPVDPAHAHPNSLSAKYGKDRQPLHTDGAHLSRPPDITVLSCASTSGVPTLLWKPEFSFKWAEAIRNGIFLVSNGRDSFYSTAYSNGLLRYDPGCMIPCDARARMVARSVEEAIQTAMSHEWNTPGMTLLIDNRQTLHARDSAKDEPGREIQRICFNLKEEKS